MSYLLDTHTLLWALTAPSRLGPQAASLLTDRRSQLVVSAASAWEISIKTRRGRLPGGARLLNSWQRSLLDLRADLLGIDHDDAIRAGGLPWAHRDPFDRMLAAQCELEDLTLVTCDGDFETFGIRTLW